MSRFAGFLQRRRRVRLSVYHCVILSLVCVLPRLAYGQANAGNADTTWIRHSVDRSSQGADGVRLGDVDNDGLPDIVTGWEEGGKIRVCFQLRHRDAGWEGVTVGEVKSPEDAVPVDVNDDGWLDIVSCCEGNQKAIFFHINPGNAVAARNGKLWRTEVVVASEGVSKWMYSTPLQQGQLVVGSKAPGGQISILQCEAAGQSSISPIRQAGWIMSLRPFDVDGDGDQDVVYSDRKGADRAVGWLESRSGHEWIDHRIPETDIEVMFLDVRRINGETVICANSRNGYLLWLRHSRRVDRWDIRRIAHPPQSGAGKAVAIGDLNQDGRLDLVCTCGLAAKLHGAYLLSEPIHSRPKVMRNGHACESWTMTQISGKKAGVKFDRIELLDLDADEDLDVLTCEERENLGVFWYENPTVTSRLQLPRR